MLQKEVDFLFQVGERRSDFGSELFQARGIGGGLVVGGEASNGFDAADTCSGGGFAEDLEAANLPGAADMGAAAEFHAVAIEGVRLAADLDHADGVAIFFAEGLHDFRAGFHVVVFHLGPEHGGVLDDAFVDEFFNVGDLLRGEGGAIEVEGQLLRAYVGTLLRGVSTDNFMQRPVQEMRHAVVTGNGFAAGLVDAHGDGGSGCQDHFIGGEVVQEGISGFLGVGDGQCFHSSEQRPGIAKLPAHLCITRRGIQNDGGLVADGDDFEDLRLGLFRVVTEERGGFFSFDFGELDNRFFPGGAGTLALLVHQDFEAFLVHRQAALAGHQFREVKRKPLLII